MSRVTISCIILVICVYSGCFAFTVNFEDLAEQGRSELETPYGGKRHKRLTLGTEVGFSDCAHIGRTCLIQRDRSENPTKVVMTACCDNLVCVGIGPSEIRNVLGQALKSDGNLSTGICSLSLDNNRGITDKEEYKEYLKGQ